MRLLLHTVQGNCVALRIFKTKNRKCSRRSAETCRRKGSFKTLKSTDTCANPFAGNPSEVVELRRAHQRKRHFQDRPYTPPAVTCPEFLRREGTGHSLTWGGMPTPTPLFRVKSQLLPHMLHISMEETAWYRCDVSCKHVQATTMKNNSKLFSLSTSDER